MTSILCCSCPLIKRKASIDTIEQKKEKKKMFLKSFCCLNHHQNKVKLKVVLHFSS